MLCLTIPFLCYQTTARDFEGEPIYEELEGEDAYTEVEQIGDEGWSGYRGDVRRESEDEGVWLEGDAGFAWEDTRMEQWRWEEEQGMGEDEYEEDDEEPDHEEEDKDKDKEEEEELWG